jgi:hypothetical protein
LRRGARPSQGTGVLAPLNFDFLELRVASGGIVSGL